MEKVQGETEEGVALSEVRLLLIGGRWSGKSSCGNTILGKERFECGRTRTAQSEVKHDEVEGRRLVVVDVPGWSSSLSLTEIPEGDKQRFKLNVSKCPPGPHAFLLTIPIDSAFTVEGRKTVEEHMKLLGERVWRYTMVLFTCGDFLGDKTIEQHIESEGDALRWLVDRCRNRYHVINNKRRTSSQVTQLLESIQEMVWHNNGGYYELDGQTLNIIREKQQDVAARAAERRRKAEEQRQQMKMLIAEETRTVQKLQMILLGSRSVGKTSVANSVLGFKDQEDGRRTARSVALQGFVGKTEVTLVDTPGWWKGFPAYDTPAAIKEEVMRSMFLCPPGPHVLLLVIDADASFNAKHFTALTTHVELLGAGVWRHAMVVFTRGDWLGAQTIEQYIEGEGEALQSLVEQCGNRYHVIDNKNSDDGTQITELLEKITETVAANRWEHFTPDQTIFQSIEEKRRRVEEGARQRQSQVKERRRSFRGARDALQQLCVIMFGQKTCGKSATGNNLLRKEVFSSGQNEHCQVAQGKVSGRQLTVIDTPGWWATPSDCTEDMDREIVRGLMLSPSGVHAVLLVVPLDLTFRDAQQVALEEHLSLFDAGVWKHAMVLFTYGDALTDKSVEEHIEREHSALRWLVDKCENKYHVVNNTKKTDMSQVTELLEKIDEMVAANSGRLFCPEMSDVYLRIDEKFSRRQLKHVLKQRLEEEYRRRELQLMMGFKEKLLELQADIRGSVSSPRPKSLDMHKIKAIGQRKRDGKQKEESIDTKISQEIENLDKDILRSRELSQGSIDFLIPDLKGGSPASSVGIRSSSQFEKVMGWLSTLQLGTNMDNQLTLNFSATSGFRSALQDDLDCDSDVPDSPEKLILAKQILHSENNL